MNLNQIHYFLAIVHTKSFSEAAYELFISQSAISKQIKSLEKELGVTLFVRNSSKRTLTPAGQLFYKYAEEMYRLHKEMLDSMESLKNDMSLSLRVGNIPGIPMYMNFNIGMYLAEFQSEYAGQNVNCTSYETTQREILRDLYGGYADFGLVRLERIPNPDDFDLLPVSLDHIVAVCNKEHPLARKQQADLQEVSRCPLLMLGKELELRELIAGVFRSLDLPMQIHGESLRPKIIQGMVSSGGDVALLPDHIVDLHTFGNIRMIPLRETIESRVVLARLKEKSPTDMGQAFWEFWKKKMKQAGMGVEPAGD